MPQNAVGNKAVLKYSKEANLIDVSILIGTFYQYILISSKALQSKKSCDITAFCLSKLKREHILKRGASEGING